MAAGQKTRTGCRFRAALYRGAHRREQARARVSAYGMTEEEIKQLVASGKAELANGRFQLLAPQDGTVIRDDFIVGELVEPGRVLFEISDESDALGRGTTDAG